MKTCQARCKIAYLPSLLGLSIMTAVAGITACSSSSGGDAEGQGGGGGVSNQGGNAGQAGSTSAAGNEGSSTPVIGAFNLELKEAVAATNTAAQTAIQGTVNDVSSPSAVVWDVSLQDNGCQLLKKRIPFCESCASGQVCTEDDVCSPNPTRQDVGEVSLSGLSRSDGESTVVLSNVNGSYQMAGVTLDYPPFAEGGQVTLSAEGGEVYPAFSIESSGIVPLELTSADPLPMASGDPVVITWTPPGSSSQSRIEVDVDISHHGGQAGRIYCDVEDNGSLTISANLVTQLMALGYSGWPSVAVKRISRGTTELSSGLVELNIFSQIDQPISIPNLVSCAGDTDCPGDQTCQSDLKCG